MANLATVLKEEIRRLARKEIRVHSEALRKAATQHRRDIAELKRLVKDQQRRIAFLEGREQSRARKEPSPALAEGARFSTRSLKSQRMRAGLSQAEYGKLVGVSTVTISNWELGKTKPGKSHLARLVELRGLGKRAAQRELQLCP